MGLNVSSISVFEVVDADKDGRLKPNEILEALEAKLLEGKGKRLHCLLALHCW
jgi:hypothetical protein